MSAPVRTRRKNTFNLFKEAEKLASFDEFPMLRPEVDPQVHASRNTVDQPFHLSCAKDTVIAQASGEARVEFPDGPVRYFDLVPGDFVYVPAGSAHRIRTLKEGVQIRYKARSPGLERVAFRCDACGAQLDAFDIDPEGAPVQQGYDFAVRRFNAETGRRQCRACGVEHDLIDLAPFRWAAIAEKLATPDDD